jgi:hypothetical protein
MNAHLKVGMLLSAAVLVASASTGVTKVRYRADSDNPRVPEQQSSSVTQSTAPMPAAPPSFGEWRMLAPEAKFFRSRSAEVSAAFVPPVDLRVTTNANPQNETCIAGDPNAPLNIVGGFNDYSVLFTGFAGNGVAYSTNGGISYTHHPTGVAMPAGFTNAGGDPAVAWNSQSRVYYAHIASAAGGTIFTRNNGVFVSSSINNGATWSPTVAVASNIWPGVGTVPFEDKEFITVDKTVGSPFQDRVYVSWTRFYPGLYPGGAATGGGDIMFSWSNTNGATWSLPIPLTDPAHQPSNGGTGTAGSSFVQGSEPAVGPDGSVYVVYWFGGRTEVVRSTNGGLTFGLPTQPFGAAFNSSGILDHDGVGSNGTQLPVMTFRVNAYPNIETNPTNASHVYVVGADDPDNSTVGDGANIIYARSTNFGATWTAPITLNDDGTGRNQVFPWMSVNATGIIQALWYDARLAVGNNLLDVYMTCSNNGGATFAPNVRITDVTFNPNTGQFSGNSFFGDYNGLGAGSLAFHGLWTDGRVGEQEIYYDRPYCACPISTTGNVNCDGALNSADIIFLVNFVFKSGAPPCLCNAVADVNCDGVVNSADIIFMVNFIFKSGAAPCDVCTLLASGVWFCP